MTFMLYIALQFKINEINLGFQHAMGEIMTYLNSDVLYRAGILCY